MSSFLKISMKLQVVDLIHEQNKSVQSSIKSTQVWSSINNSFLRTNPLPINPIIVCSKVNTYNYHCHHTHNT